MKYNIIFEYVDSGLNGTLIYDGQQVFDYNEAVMLVEELNAQVAGMTHYLKEIL